jgi:hypothetical protein
MNIKPLNMLKNFIWITIASLAMFSCSLSKDNRALRTSVNGSWQLTNVRYEGNQGRFESVLFNDEKDACFIGSEWFFRTNNSNGSYTITKPDCQTGQRFFIWSLVEGFGNGYALQIKPTDNRRNTTLNNAGYRLDVSNLNGGQMTLRSQLQVDGEPITLVYEFQKLTF